MTRLTLPFPPSINGYWRAFRGRQILSKRGREYRTQALASLTGQAHQRWPADKRLSVTLTLYPPTKRRFDIDNFSKAVLDLLTHAGIYDDDSQIDVLLVKRGPVTKGGAASVEIQEAPKND